MLSLLVCLIDLAFQFQFLHNKQETEANKTIKMAESTISSQQEISNPQTLVPSVDDMTNFGWKQLLQAMLVSLALFIDAQQSFISIFSDSQPTWHCTNHTTCSSNSDICKLSRSAWTWDGPSSKTIISQWFLQCASSIITGLPQSSFFIGSFIGGFLLATLADSSLGRKNLLLVSCLTMSLTSMVISFSTNVWIYSALKFLIGFCRSPIGTCTLVLLTEKVGKQWRFRVGILAFFCFSIGFLSLPAIAYVNRDSSWTSLYLWTSVPALCYSVCVHFHVTESPRWLLMQGREEEALALLRGIAPRNGDGNLAANRLQVPDRSKASIGGTYSSIAAIFEKNWALQRMVAVMVLAFGIGMVYYGMPLGVGNLGFNIYLAVMFNALLEIPSYIATYLLENCKRRTSILAFTTLSGMCSIICVVIPKGLQGPKIGLELASFFSSCTACNVLLIYIIELFPTCVRNTATGMVRQAIVCGAIFGPFLASAGRKSDIFSYGVFGLVITFCGFSVAYLPETQGTTLCDTMDQQEHKESIAV